jgi:hypothetical protein
MVLAHELAHIQRHDWMVQVLADAARAIYWFNPIFWLASSRLRRESEHACDDAVIRLGAAGTSYAEELLAMTRALRSEDRLQSPILAMAQPSHLEQRLVALLNPSLNRLAATPWAVIVVAGVAIALTLPLAAVRPEAEAPREVSNAKAQPALSPATSTPAIPQPDIPSVKAAPAAGAVQPKPRMNAAGIAPTAPAIAQPEFPRVDSASLNRTSAVGAARPELRAEAPPVTPASALVPEPGIATPVAEVVTPPSPPFECKVTSSEVRLKTASIEKTALGNGPWIINEDRTIWAADQPYVANRSVNTVWMRPANTELTITARRLDGDAPELAVGQAAPYSTGYIAIGVVFPAAGCWEVTGTAGTSKLTFITRVRD